MTALNLFATRFDQVPPPTHSTRFTPSPHRHAHWGSPGTPKAPGRQAAAAGKQEGQEHENRQIRGRGHGRERRKTGEEAARGGSRKSLPCPNLLLLLVAQVMGFLEKRAEAGALKHVLFDTPGKTSLCTSTAFAA